MPDKPLPGVPDPEHPGWNTLARFSAEQTAEFFGGGQLGKPIIDDPELARKQALQQVRLATALAQSVDLFVGALQELSPDSARQLRGHYLRMMDGEDMARRYFVAMYTELCAQALNR